MAAELGFASICQMEGARLQLIDERHDLLINAVLMLCLWSNFEAHASQLFVPCVHPPRLHNNAHQKLGRHMRSKMPNTMWTQVCDTCRTQMTYNTLDASWHISARYKNVSRLQHKSPRTLKAPTNFSHNECVC